LDAAQSAEAQRKTDNAQKLQDKQQEVVQLEK
jgi:hypothetical protein